jgi:hypothetical protein
MNEEILTREMLPSPTTWACEILDRMERTHDPDSATPDHCFDCKTLHEDVRWLFGGSDQHRKKFSQMIKAGKFSDVPSESYGLRGMKHDFVETRLQDQRNYVRVHELLKGGL